MQGFCKKAQNGKRAAELNSAANVQRIGMAKLQNISTSNSNTYINNLFLFLFFGGGGETVLTYLPCLQFDDIIAWENPGTIADGSRPPIAVFLRHGQRVALVEGQISRLNGGVGIQRCVKFWIKRRSTESMSLSRTPYSVY